MGDVLEGLMCGDVPALDDVLERPSWHLEAACRESSLNFFPERGQSLKELRAVCAGCAVRVECLASALEHCDKAGVWGGLSENERRRLRRRGA